MIFALHMGTVVWLALLGLWLVVGVIAWREEGDYLSRNYEGVVIMLSIALLFMTVVVASTALGSVMCEQDGRDLAVETDFSWAAGCRAPVVIDGETLMVSTEDIRLFQQLEISR